MKKIKYIPLFFVFILLLSVLTPDSVSAQEFGVSTDSERAVRSHKGKVTSAGLDSRDQMGRTALMRAVWRNRIDIVTRLLSMGSDPNLKDHMGQSSLFFALQFNHNDSILNLLLEAGARVDTLDRQGRSPFEILVSRGAHPEFLGPLVKAGKMPSPEEPGYPGGSLFFTALDLPEGSLKVQFLEALYEAGVSLKWRSISGRTPQEEALFRDDRSSAETLAALDARLNESFIDAMDYNGRDINETEVQDFLRRGASPLYRNRMGYNVCHYTVAAGRPDLLEQIIESNPGISPFQDDPRELQNLILFFPLDYNWDTALSLMELLLDQGLSVNIRDDQGQTLLSRSIRHSSEVASLLIRRGADPNYLDPEGVSPMMTALTIELDDDSSLLEELVAAGADLQARDSQGWDILTYALLYQQNSRIIEKLIALGVSPDVRDDYGTPGFFWAAAFAEDSELVTSLVSGKGRAQWRDKDGWTPLMGALHFGNSPEVIAVLADETPDGRIKDGTGKNLEAFKRGYEQTTSMKAPVELDRLIRNKRIYPVDGIPRGGNLNESLIEVVRWGQDPAMAKALITAGADPDASDVEGFTSLMAAAAFNSYEMVLALISSGASVFDATPYGWTPLHLAGWTSDPRTASLLMNEGWNVNVRDFENWTPLMWAMRNHASLDYIQLLMEAGADPGARTYRNETVLHLSCSAWVPPSPDTLELLVKAGADVNGINLKGETPLFHAAAMGYTEVCRFLLDKGADPSLMDIEGTTAYSRAYNNGHFETAELLR